MHGISHVGLLVCEILGIPHVGFCRSLLICSDSRGGKYANLILLTGIYMKTSYLVSLRLSLSDFSHTSYTAGLRLLSIKK